MICIWNKEFFSNIYLELLAILIYSNILEVKTFSYTFADVQNESYIYTVETL